MFTKYLVKYASLEIKETEAARETAKTVWVQNQYTGDIHKQAKISSSHRYFSSWQDAHAYLLRRATRNVENAQLELTIANRKLEVIKNMKAPASSISE